MLPPEPHLGSSYASAFAAALIDPGRETPAVVAGPNGKAVVKRYNVYRNNVTSSLIDALAAIYPAGAPLVDRTGSGPRTVAALQRILGTEAAAGVSVEDGHVSDGIASIAAAALDHTGRPVAAISVSLPSAGLARRRPDVTDAVTRAAATLTRRLAGR